MIKKYFYYLVVSLFALGTGCEENFSPKGEFREEYVLTSILESSPNSSDLYLTAWLSKFYDVPGYDPSLNHIDPSVSGAELILSHPNGNKYTFYEDTIPRFDTSRYKTDRTMYYTIFPRPSGAITIEVETPDGTLLSAQTTVPAPQYALSYSYPFIHGITTAIDQWRWGKEWIITWDKGNSHLFFPRFTLFYSYLGDSIEIARSMEIPLTYLKKSGESDPVYPSYTYDNTISWEYNSIDTLMARISKGDPNKENYKINYFLLDVIEFDKNLSNYFSSTNGYLDEYSIRIDQTTYSNVRGGIGIFGSSTSNSRRFEADKSYVLSFGYKYGGP